MTTPRDKDKRVRAPKSAGEVRYQTHAARQQHIDATASTRSRIGDAAEEGAERFLEYMAKHASVSKAPSGNMMVKLENLQSLTPELQEDASQARMFARGYTSNIETSLTMNGRGIGGNGFPRRGAPRTIPVTCELSEFKKMCDYFGIKDLSAELGAAFEGNEPPPNGHAKKHQPRGRNTTRTTNGAERH